MPHSSGGGSHGGGSHGGSHSSHGSGSGGSSYIRVSNSPFKGATRYIGYSNGKPDIIYSSNSNLNAKTPKFFQVFEIVFFIPFILIGIYLLSSIIVVPKKIDCAYSDIIIVDSTDRFTDAEENELLNVLTEFRNKTGVPVCITTVENSSWKDYYTDLSAYAYELYVNRFFDEYHWLIVYSDDLSDRQDSSQFSDWYFEGMQGDNTDSILSDSLTSEFNENLNKNLLITSNTTGEAFIESFKWLNNNAIHIRFNSDMILMALFWNTCVGIILFTVVHNLIVESKYVNYVPYKDNLEKNEIWCDYCGGLYYKGTVTSCPHCGAAISKTKGEQENL